LVEITAEIFKQKDELSKKDLIDSILDSAKQKGTGGWTSEDAIKLQIPTPTIDTAVFMRDLSVAKNQRELINKQIEGPAVLFENDNTELLAWLEQALYFAMMTSYAQGFALMQAASKTYGFNLKPEDISKVWKGGCIIRAEMLDKIQSAFEQQTELWNLMMDETIAHKLMHKQHSLRKVIQMGVEAGLPMPAFMSALSYYDAYRSAWLPANLIQAQRDFFGAHTYERNDRAGIFHSQWHQNKVK
jgi:6-phosphogluconate dehydrogenase